MTENQRLTKQKTDRKEIGIGSVLFGCFSAFCLALLLKNSQAAVEYVTRGLLLSAKVVIPSLFPFMVLSELILSLGVVNRLPKALLKPLRYLLGLPDAGVSAVLLGLLCGFPIGARCVVSAYGKGYLTKPEAERALACSSGPSSAFLIGAVGGSLWENRRFGVVLYLTVLGVSLLTGMASYHLRHKKSDDHPLAPAAFSAFAEPPKKPLAESFCDAVKSSLGGILLVCAYVVFFSALSGALGLVLASLSLTPTLTAVLSCILELSSGSGQAAALPNAYVGACLSAFAAGWTGLSVHCQMLAVCQPSRLSLRPYLRSKLLQGLLAALLVGLLVSLSPELLLPAEVCLSP